MDQPPQDVIDAGNLGPARIRALPWGTPLWRCDFDVGSIVLSSRAGLTTDTLRWETALLDGLEGEDFPASRSARIFGGADHIECDGLFYVARTWIVGDVLSGRPTADLGTVGAFIATFHDATSKIALPQRPGIPPLAEVLLTPDDAALLTALGEEPSVRRYRMLVDGLLDRIADDRTVHPIHGDFTTRNIVVDAEPPIITGLIDFGMAMVSTPSVELAFALGSARPSFDHVEHNLGRIAEMIGGYTAVRSLSADDAPRITAYAGCRPLLHIAIHAISGRRARSSVALDRSAWIVDNDEEMTDAIASAL